MSESTESYIVYEVLYKKRTVYIGIGSDPKRYLHAKSGKSHNPKLNELFFKDGDNMEVNVICENLSKEDAMEKEKDFISAYEPEFNIIHNPNNRKIKKFRKYTV